MKTILRTTTSNLCCGIARLSQRSIRSVRKIIVAVVIFFVFIPYVFFTSSQYHLLTTTTRTTTKDTTSSSNDDDQFDRNNPAMTTTTIIIRATTESSAKLLVSGGNGITITITNRTKEYSRPNVLTENQKGIIRQFMSSVPNTTLCSEVQSILENRTTNHKEFEGVNFSRTTNDSESGGGGGGVAPTSWSIVFADLWNADDRSGSGGWNLLEPGGWWRPTGCIPRHTTAVIIPYRDREGHLAQLLRRLHQVLRVQLISYRVFIVEQGDTELFNKGALLNIGFLFVREHYPDYECVVFHDVDLLPENELNFYTCPDQSSSTSPAAVRHMSPGVNTLHYRLPYPELVGGVLAVRPSVFVDVNGYSNLYRGWGGEDDDMYERLHVRNIQILRPPSSIGRYKMIWHPGRPKARNRYRLLRSAKWRYKTDGLSNIVPGMTYNIVSVAELQGYTHILIALNHSSTTKYWWYDNLPNWCFYVSAYLLVVCALYGVIIAHTVE